MSRRHASFPASRSFSPVPVHPGEHLREDFMRPLGLSVNALALALRVPATRILAIVSQKRRISPDTALRLARYFKMSPEFWLNLQTHYELALAEHDSLPTISREVFPCEQLEGIRQRVRLGNESIERGEFSAHQGRSGLRKLADKVKARGRNRLQKASGE
jgi:addiction module HigA family antidote